MQLSTNRLRLLGEKLGISVFLLLLLSIFAVCVVTFTTTYLKFNTNKQILEDIQTRQKDLAMLRSSMSNAEATFRIYLLSGDSGWLSRLRSEQSSFVTIGARLEAVPHQRRPMQQALKLISEKFFIQNNLIAQHRHNIVPQGPLPQDLRLLFNAKNRNVQTGLKASRLIDAMDQTEKRLLVAYNNQYNIDKRSFVVQLILAAFFLVGALLILYLQYVQKLSQSRRSASDMQALLSSTYNGFYLLDPGGNIRLMNHHGKEYLEALAERPVRLGDNLPAILPASLRNEIATLYQEVLGGRETLVHRKIMLNGRQHTIQLQHRAITKQGATTPTGISILAKDITQQLEAEAAVRSGETARRLIMDAVQDAVLCLNQEGRITFWNSKAETIFGWSESEALGKLLTDTIIPAASRKEHEASYLHPVLASGNTSFNKLVEIDAVDRNGRQLPVEMYILSLGGDEDMVACAYIRDISERKRSENERNELLERLRLTNSMVQLGTWQFNLSTLELVCDEVMYAVLDLPAGYQLDYRKWMDLVHPDDRDMVVRNWRVILKQDADTELYFRIISPQGKIKYLYQKAVRHQKGIAGVPAVIGGVIDVTAMKKAEATFAQVVNASPNALLLVNGEGQIILANAQSEKLFGYPEQELRQISVNKVLPGHANIIQTRLQAGTGGEPKQVLELDQFARRKNGSELPVEIGLSSLELEGEQLVLASVVDISQRKAAEAEKKDLIARFELAAAATQLGIWEFELATGHVVWNENMYELVALPNDVPMSFEHWCSLIHPEDVPMVQNLFERVVEQELSQFEMEYRIVMPDGTLKVLSQKAITFKNEEGVVTRCLGTSLDVTEQRQAQAVREELLTRFELAAETLHLGILDADLHSGSVQGDVQLKLMLGIEAIPQPDWRVWVRQVHPDDRAHLQQLLMQALPQNQILEAEWRQLRDNGDVRHFETKARIIWKLGQPARLIAATIDITNQVAQREELLAAKIRAEKSEQLQEQFLANMSHEIRTPLNGIVGMADLMSSTQLTPRQSEYLEVIQNSSHGLLNIINDVLDFSKIKAGKFNIEKAPFNLHHVILSAFELLLHKANLKGLNYQLEVDPDVPMMVVGDAGRLSQVLINLLGNAVKFTRQGNVVLTVHAAGLRNKQVRLLFTVTDTGIGIAEEDLNEVFNSFSQGSREVGIEFGGTGLGLAISKQLVELQGGFIEVESTLGVGSSFRVLMVYEVAENVHTVIPKNDVLAAITQYAGKRVLVAEDNEVNRMVIGEYLQKMQLDATLVHDGQKALDALQSLPPFDLVILDLRMPVLNGLETAKAIREDLKLTVPIMALTASALRSEKDRCLSVGMNAYMAKPFKSSELYDTILRLLGGIQPASNSGPDETPPDQNAPLYDLTELEQLGEPEFALQIIDTFRTNGIDTLKEVDEAYAEGIMKTVFELVHRMKSGAGMLGAAALLDLLRQTETEARKEQPDIMLVGTLIQAVSQQFEKVCAALEEAKNEVANW